MEIDDLLIFWGKARAVKDADSATHPLLAHMLDVAAVAMHLPTPLLGELHPSTLAFFTALHDIGKVSRSFQALSALAWPEKVLGPRNQRLLANPPRHDTLGLHWLENVLVDEWDHLLPREEGWRAPGARSHLWRALAGHHGKPVESLDFPPGPDIICDHCRDAGLEMVRLLRNLLRPEPWRLPGGTDLKAVSWHIAGLVTLADWIGSRASWFPYVAPEAFGSPEAYWQQTLAQARKAVEAANVLPAAAASPAGLKAFFPTIQLPSPLQVWAETVELPKGPCLAVIEDLTGSGKTEAALLLAHRLMAAGQADGVFIALPTMATANAMYARLSKAYRRLFRAEKAPSLVLAHGRADLHRAFRETIRPETLAHGWSASFAEGDETAEAQCSAWLAEDRRRALLAQVGVGTIDQVLFGILPVRHAALRLRGLASKVLIIDEAHAFDPYMGQEVQALLRFHAALGGSAILLSATLPQKKRTELMRAYQEGLRATDRPEAINVAYPLATLVSAEGVLEQSCMIRAGLARDLPVRRLPDAATALAEVLGAAARGAATVWIRNTVDDVLTASAELRAAGIEPLIFHARFAMQDRLSLEEEVLRCFGKDSRGKERARILIATQVVEQSLDIDFDVLITDLAPMDLLIQRAGRLWRHRERVGRPVSHPELLIVSPEPIENAPANWLRASLPGTAAVYRDPGLLWRGARALFSRGVLRAPQELRALIEEASNGDFPSALANEAERAEGKDSAAGGLARQQVLDWAKGYALDSGDWRPDTVTPTRLQDNPRVTLRLAVRQGSELVPYAKAPEPGQAWSLSEVSVSRRRVTACPVPEGLEAAAKLVRESWGKWLSEAPDVLLAVLEPEVEAEVYWLWVQDSKNTTLCVRYESGAGLIW